MKKIFIVFSYVLMVLMVLLPLGTSISSLLGYTFQIASISAYTIAVASLSICTVAFSIITKGATENNVIKVLFALLTPLSLLHAVFCLLYSHKVCVIDCTLICISCSLFLTIKYGKPLAFKITTLIISALLTLPVGFIFFIVLIFGDLGQNTVVMSVESPNETYYAEVIDSNQGALGGNTFVDVYENKGLNAIIFTISKKPQRIYQGDWGEFEYMAISWKNDHCLVINSVSYEIK